MSAKIEWVTIKIPATAYRRAVALREVIARRGIDALPPELQETAEISAGTGRSIGIGIIVTMALVGLDQALGGSARGAAKKPTKRRR